MMVRKPIASKKYQSSQDLPYPATPTDSRAGDTHSPGFPRDTSSEALVAGEQSNNGGLDAPNDANIWASAEPSPNIRHDVLPATLRVGAADANASRPVEHSLPPSLQIGSTDATPRSSWESQRSSLSIKNDVAADLNTQDTAALPPTVSSTNPFRRKQDHYGKQPERPDYGEESSTDAWATGGRKSLSYQRVIAGAYLPQLSFGILANVLQDPLAHLGNRDETQIVPDSSQTPFADPWMGPKAPSNQFGSAQLDARLSGAEAKTESEGLRVTQDNRAAEAPEVNMRQKEVYHTPQPGLTRDPAQTSVLPSYTEGSGPSLPPRSPQQQVPLPPDQPPRPFKADNGSDGSSSGPVPAVRPQSEDPARPRRASETYQIRLVNWVDATSTTNPRRSPIMVQNANGPCPLLALVNALVLSTPSHLTTALMETLRVREQVSLGLLLDAVIDELMSGRRGDAAQNLPDVSDLYAFLVNLHTGMNVNPCFVSPDEKEVGLIDAPIDPSTNLHDLRKPGGFEDTREMRLYRTFAIPLIHGWIPPRNHPAFAAVKRAARTYEDAQNLMFREEELEEKLQQQGLSQEEQSIFEDIASVKYFLSSTATQLTGYGLDTITESLAPGSVAILFRNDHFSTLYKHPRSGQLLTLVTDMGYAGHDEVVWESLVDVSGEGCEFYAGDYRPVGNIAGDTQQPIDTTEYGDESGWTTVNNRTHRGHQSNRSATQSSSNATSQLPPLETMNLGRQTASLSPNIEQEDHDLALAMQLQEEEEERERQEAAARRREDELSQAYLNNSDAQGRRTFPGFGRGAQSGPTAPPRNGSNARQAPRRKDSSDDIPPPSYEQAAKGPAYYPPASHPAHPYSSPSPSGNTPRPQPQRPRQSSAYSEHAAVSPYGGSPSAYGPPRRGPPPRGRGPSFGGGTGGYEGMPGGFRRRNEASASAVSDEERKDKDCVVM